MVLKYRIFLTFVLVGISMGLFSQLMTVEDFKQETFSMEARFNDLRDQNGNECALIKVQTTINDLLFDTDLSSSIVQVIDTVAEYWLFVSEGSKRLIIKHDDRGILRYQYPQNIKKLNVYTLVLSDNYEARQVTKETPMQYLTITSFPNGADVYLDGDFRGTSDNFSQKLEVKRYTYRLEKHLYHSEAGVVTLNPDETTNLNVQLKPNFGYVNISSIPEQGAKVEIDGEPVPGVTPIRSDKLKSGTYTARIKKLNYKTKTIEFEVKDEQTEELTIELEPNFADITVEATNDAEIYIDDVRRGQKNAVQRLTPGIHIFEARKTAYRTDRKQFEVIAGQAATVSLHPIPITGNADINSQPWGATIFLDGDSIGKTPKQISNLLIGSYNLRLEKTGFMPLTVPLTIKEGERTTINPMLSSGKGAIVEITSNPSSASLYLNGEYSGNTPFQKELGAGVYTYQLEFPKYHNKTGEFEVVRKDDKQHEHFRLNPNFGNITVNSFPTGAKVFLDEEDTGLKTPCSIEEVISGKHTIKLVRTGYADHEEIVNVVDSKTAEIIKQLEATFAKVTVRSSSEAMIYVDGELAGVANWEGELIAGPHTIEVQMKDHYPESKEINLVAGQDETVSLIPEPIVGQLEINTYPENVKIEIDNMPAGKTPLNLYELPIGTYAFSARYKRYPPVAGLFEIQEKTSTNVSFTMQRDNFGKVMKSLSLSLIPGVGQMYYGHGGEGFLYMAATFGTAGAAIYYNQQMRYAYDEYLVDYDEYKSAISGQLQLESISFANEHLQEMTDYATKRNYLFGISAAIYLYNLLDAALMNQNLRFIKGKENFNFTIETYKNEFLLGMDYKF